MLIPDLAKSTVQLEMFLYFKKPENCQGVRLKVEEEKKQKSLKIAFNNFSLNKN